MARSITLAQRVTERRREPVEHHRAELRRDPVGRAVEDVRRSAHRQHQLAGAALVEVDRDLRAGVSGPDHQDVPAGVGLGVAVLRPVDQLTLERVDVRPRRQQRHVLVAGGHHQWRLERLRSGHHAPACGGGASIPGTHLPPLVRTLHTHGGGGFPRGTPPPRRGLPRGRAWARSGSRAGSRSGARCAGAAGRTGLASWRRSSRARARASARRARPASRPPTGRRRLLRSRSPGARAPWHHGIGGAPRVGACPSSTCCASSAARTAAATRWAYSSRAARCPAHGARSWPGGSASARPSSWTTPCAGRSRSSRRARS